MEYVNRLFFNKATPTDDEIRLSRSDKLEYLVIRKTKLSMIIFLCISDLIKTIYLLSDYDTDNSKGIIITNIVLNIIVTLTLIYLRIAWYADNSFKVGSIAFFLDTLKLFTLMVPFFYVDKPSTIIEDLQFVVMVILPWYLPYLTIIRLFRFNADFLRPFSSRLFDIWKVLSIIYLPISIFAYGFVINITAIYLNFSNNNLPNYLIIIIYILWTINILELIALYYNMKKTSNVLSVIWIIIVITILNYISEWLLSFGINLVVS